MFLNDIQQNAQALVIFFYSSMSLVNKSKFYQNVLNCKFNPKAIIWSMLADYLMMVKCNNNKSLADETFPSNPDPSWFTSRIISGMWKGRIDLF